MSRSGLLVLLAGLVVFTGCHTYTPVEMPAPGLVARLVIPLQSAVADPNAAAQTVAVEGTVLESGDTIVLATETRRDLTAFSRMIQFDTFRVATDGLVSIETREFSSGKSIALGIAITGAATMFALSALAIDDGQAGGDKPGDGTNPEGAIVISSSVVSLVWKLIGG
jgi:hypothetical protein